MAGTEAVTGRDAEVWKRPRREVIKLASYITFSRIAFCFSARCCFPGLTNKENVKTNAVTAAPRHFVGHRLRCLRRRRPVTKQGASGPFFFFHYNVKALATEYESK